MEERSERDEMLLLIKTAMDLIELLTKENAKLRRYHDSNEELKRLGILK